MYLGDEGICRAGDDGAGRELIAFRGAPDLVKPSEGEGFGIGKLVVVRLLGTLRGVVPPFKKAISENQAAAVFEGTAEGRLFVNRFRAGVDEPAADIKIFGPGGN